MPEGCTPGAEVRNCELQHFQFAASRDWNRAPCPRCPGLRTPSIHSDCCRDLPAIAHGLKPQLGEDCNPSYVSEGDVLGTNHSGLLAKGISNAIPDGLQKKPRGRKSSRYYGVRYRPDLNKWVAEIRVRQWKTVAKKIWLGTFETDEGAARAVDCARKLLQCVKPRRFNFPCERLIAYSERIPSDLDLTDVDNAGMFKTVTFFVKRASQAYAAEFCPIEGKSLPGNSPGLERSGSEECQALVSGLPVLNAPSPRALSEPGSSISDSFNGEPSFDYNEVATVEKKPTFVDVLMPAVSDVSTICDEFAFFKELADAEYINEDLATCQWPADGGSLTFETSDYADHTFIHVPSEGFEHNAWCIPASQEHHQLPSPKRVKREEADSIDCVVGSAAWPTPPSTTVHLLLPIEPGELDSFSANNQLFHSPQPFATTGFTEEQTHDLYMAELWVTNYLDNCFADSASPQECWLQTGSSMESMPAEQLQGFNAAGQYHSPGGSTIQPFMQVDESNLLLDYISATPSQNFSFAAPGPPVHRMQPANATTHMEAYDQEQWHPRGGY